MGRYTTLIIIFVIGALFGGGVYALVDAGDDDSERRTPREVSTSPSPDETPSANHTVPSSPTPTSDGRFSGLESDDPLRLDGIGGLEVGMTVVDAERATNHQIDVGDDFTEACRYATPVDGPQGLAFMISYGEIVRIDVFEGSTIETLSGIGIGQDENEVFEAYGNGIERQPHPYLGDEGSYLVYRPREDTHLLLIFETRRGNVISFRSGFKEQVRYIEGCA